MSKSTETFNHIVNTLSKANKNVSLGKMMSSPGIKFKKKVFAFLYNDQMIFKLGKDFDLAAYQITTYSHLSPFKNKPPMTNWYQIDVKYHGQWLELAKKSLAKIQKEA